MRVCLVIVHFGSRPAWYPLWARSAAWNKNIDFHLFSDWRAEGAPNIYFHELTIAALNRSPILGSERISIGTAYKACDLRPLFADIFGDVIKDYVYWGWGDLDVLYGDLWKQLGPSFGNFDYIATGRRGESGPLAFLRNCSEVNELWRGIPDVHRKINDGRPAALDEQEFLELLKLHVQCDLVFRECLDDLPAQWKGGQLVGVESGRAWALHHFGGRLSHTRRQISGAAPKLAAAMKRGDPIRVAASGRIFVETPFAVASDWAEQTLRRAKARVRALL